MLNKSDLSPFTRVKAKNGKYGILIIFEDSEIMCFEDLIIFLSKYNDDLTLKSLDGTIIEGDLDPYLKEYRFNSLVIKDAYYNYEIINIYKANNFNNTYKIINFEFLKNDILKLKERNEY